MFDFGFICKWATSREACCSNNKNKSQMALDFYSITDTSFTERIFSVEADDADFAFAFAELKKRTSLTVDAYGTSRIYPSHIVVLKAVLNEKIATLNIYKGKGLRERLSTLINHLSEAKEGFIVIGD
jgi:hypothetical protein